MKKYKWLKPSLTVSLIYIIFGFLWITLSDALLLFFVSDQETYTTLQTWTGWFYVIITAFLVFHLTSRGLRKVMQQEQEISESRARLALALTAVRDGVWDWDVKRNAVYFSPRYYEMLGFTPDEFPASFEAWRSLLHPEDKKRSEAIIADYLKKIPPQGIPDTFSTEFRLRTKDGNWRWILSRGQIAARDTSNLPVRVIGTHVDITERKETEEYLLQSEKMISIGGLAAGMAHEINNPLSGISGAAQNLNSRLLSDNAANRKAAQDCNVSLDAVHAYLEQRQIPRMVQGILESVERASTIVKNMLAFSRKTSRSFSYHSVEELLEATVQLASTDYNLKQHYDFRQITILRNYEPNTPQIACDGNQLQQVFLNILKNAAEALHEKGIPERAPEIVLRLHTEADHVVISIEDNGPGMNDAVRKRIFEPFFTTKSIGYGTGLGLSISYFIITNEHKGEMEVTSSIGNWTKFTIRLPVHNAELTKQQLQTNETLLDT
ncbi:two-component system sensor histidine kinase NtrB [Oleidesulfovibrio sp.]|uniref:two-component system sensor histidine kinase NtrB n=1 Tax=Oleidesulfovibrio sp. TaxID=2909707 RepID=UPI003A89F798